MSITRRFFLFFITLFHYSHIYSLEAVTKLPALSNSPLSKTFFRKFSSSAHVKKPIAGISFLKEKNKKIVLLHDKHDQPASLDNISQIHQQEITKLITRLKERTSKSSFYIEFSTRTKNFQFTQAQKGINIPIQDALKHNFSHGSILYKPFNHRTEADFWLLQMFVNCKAVDLALKNKVTIPKEFYDVSIKNYYQDLEKKKQEVQSLITLLPTEIASQVSDKVTRIAQLQFYIVNLANYHQIPLDNHFFELVKKISLAPDQENKLFITLLQIQSIETDLSLAHSLIQDSEKTAIVHAGAYHTQQVENCLLGCKYQMVHEIKNGLNAQNLATLTWPTKFETTFTDQILNFIDDK